MKDLVPDQQQRTHERYTCHREPITELGQCCEGEEGEEGET